ADNAGGTGPVVDHDLLAENLADAVLDGAGDEIGRATRRERHDHHDGAVRISAGVLAEAWRGEQKEQGAAERRGDCISRVFSCHGLSRPDSLLRPMRSITRRETRLPAPGKCGTLMTPCDYSS